MRRYHVHRMGSERQAKSGKTQTPQISVHLQDHGKDGARIECWDYKKYKKAENRTLFSAKQKKKENIDRYENTGVILRGRMWSKQIRQYCLIQDKVRWVTGHDGGTTSIELLVKQAKRKHHKKSVDLEDHVKDSARVELCGLFFVQKRTLS